MRTIITSSDTNLLHKANRKREDLVKAAITLTSTRGVNNWTLNECAELANVPLGNVYYYYKTKELLTEEVLKREPFNSSFFPTLSTEELYQMMVQAQIELYRKGVKLNG